MIPLPTKVLQNILSESGSLRTSVGRVAEIHSYMSYMDTYDVSAAIRWTETRKGKQLGFIPFSKPQQPFLPHKSLLKVPLHIERTDDSLTQDNRWVGEYHPM